MYSAPSNDGGLFCMIRNAGTSEIVGTIETVSFGGVSTGNALGVTLLPGQGNGAFFPSGVSCKVTLTKGSPKKVRGVAIYNFGTDGAYTIPIQ